jgi:hypothetical protein
MNFYRLTEDVAAGSLGAFAITGVALAFVGGAMLSAEAGELAFFAYIALSLGGIPAFLIWLG